jgi:malonyl CoA-acyl carrier protein transacylase
MKAAGIKPDGIVGHSVGELGCSYMDGCFTAEQMMLAAYYRGRASIETELIKGLMAAVGKFANELSNCPVTQVAHMNRFMNKLMKPKVMLNSCSSIPLLQLMHCFELVWSQF